MLNAMMKVHGQIGSDRKLLIGKSITEFLRITHMEDGSARGFINRSIPNLIVTDFQNLEVERNNPQAIVSGLAS